MLTNEFVKQYEGLVKQIAFEYEKNTEVFEDLVQAMWLHICEKAAHLPADSRANSTWIHIVCSNYCKNYLRGLNTELEVVMDSTLTPPMPPEDDEGAPAGSFLEETVISPYNDPDELVAMDELSVNLGALSDQEKRVFRARYLEGKSYEDIAKAEAADASTVRTVTERIREKAGMKRKNTKANSRPTFGGIYADWSFKPKGLGNIRMGPTKCVCRSDLIKISNATQN